MLARLRGEDATVSAALDAAAASLARWLTELDRLTEENIRLMAAGVERDAPSTDAGTPMDVVTA